MPRSHELICLFPITCTVYKHLYLDRETGTLYNGSLLSIYFARPNPHEYRIPPSCAGRSTRPKVHRQCLVWSEESPPRYSRDLPLDHTSRPGGILLQVGPSLIDLDGEYRGGGVVEEVEGNEGGDASVE